MSTALNPSPWYSFLVNYKNGNDQAHTLLAALTAAYLAEHAARIKVLLGEDFTHVVVVPSTRGRPFAVHPLPRAIRRVISVRDRLVNALTHVPEATIARQEYKPSIYQVDTVAIRNGRVLLIEDLWVSGARAMSGAGALLTAGAKSVVILPIAREFRAHPDFCPEEYAQAAAVPFDITNWPRK